MKDTILFERVTETDFRVICFEHDPETGAKSVKDIAELVYEKRAGIQVVRWFGENIEIYETMLEGVDFGQARILSSRIQKCLDHMFSKKFPADPLPPAKVFTHKTYRCEWIIYAQEVDQYGSTIIGTQIIYDSWPTFDEANAHKEEFLEFTGVRWVPKKRDHGYWTAGVSYREVEV